MFMFDEFMFYRSRQEAVDRRYDLRERRQAQYQTNRQKLAEAIAGDNTGDGFVREMFVYELDNHEYGYTMDTEDTLDALGYTADEILGNPRLKRGIEKAVTEICGRD